MTYADELEGTKTHLPFQSTWKKHLANGLEQYTDENRARAETILNNLIASLIALGEQADESEKVAHFETAVMAFNDLNDDADGCLIETGEREELCDLFNRIGLAAGIDVETYGDGEGLASEWRDW